MSRRTKRKKKSVGYDNWAGGGLEDGKDESMLNNEGERE